MYVCRMNMQNIDMIAYMCRMQHEYIYSFLDGCTSILLVIFCAAADPVYLYLYIRETDPLPGIIFACTLHIPHSREYNWLSKCSHILNRIYTDTLCGWVGFWWCCVRCVCVCVCVGHQYR